MKEGAYSDSIILAREETTGCFFGWSLSSLYLYLCLRTRNCILSFFIKFRTFPYPIPPYNCGDGDGGTAGADSYYGSGADHFFSYWDEKKKDVVLLPQPPGSFDKETLSAF